MLLHKLSQALPGFKRIVSRYRNELRTLRIVLKPYSIDAVPPYILYAGKLGGETLAKIKLEDLIKVLKSDVISNKSCIEMNFCIENDTEYDDCWIGKMPDRDNPNKEIYWYGLVRDGSQAYDYEDLEDILHAKVFGKSMFDVIEKVNWYSLDGCSIEERLPDYLGDSGLARWLITSNQN